MKVVTYAVLDMESLEWLYEESYDHEGSVEKCCGPSQSEQILASQQNTFSQQLEADQNTQFQKQSEIIGNLNSILNPIANAGPNQQGFNAQQLAALNTQAINTTGANYANAARAINGQLAGHTDDSGLESGVAQQVKGSIASSAANQLSNEELGITNANYAQGRQNWQTALGGEQALAGLENPVAYANPATSANSSAFGEADKIQQEESQKQAAIAGGIASLATGALTFGAGGFGNLDTTGGSTGGEQFGNFLSGGFGALAGQ